jgi:hypothetical protein
MTIRRVLVEARRLLLGVLLAVIVVNLGTGCGAMFNEPAPAIPVHVTPPGARIYVDGLYVAQAPSYVRLTAANPHVVQVAADGYEAQTIQVTSQANGGYIILDCLLILALIVPGIIALAVDGGTGAWRTLDVQALSIQLQPAARPAPPGPPVSPASPSVPAPAEVPAVPQQGVAPAPAPAGCQYDSQCKGNRICAAGTCVEPGQRAAPAPPTAPPPAPPD